MSDFIYDPNKKWPKIGQPIALESPISVVFDPPEHYLPDSDLVAAVNVALLLGQPLLLTGEPGTGKTQLAYHVARSLGLLKPIKFEVKSTTESKELFYTVDSLRQFRDYSCKEKDETLNPLEYIEFQALGLAILRAADLSDAALRAKRVHSEETDLWQKNQQLYPDFPHRSLVLIDEIDKAPRDVPNDLLNEIENAYFKLPEIRDHLGGNDRLSAPNHLRPIVIFTSNSEKSLPSPFLRRCVYYHIEFPKQERLAEIIEQRMPEKIARPLLDDVLSLVYNYLRKGARALDDKPGTAEILAFLMALHRLGVPKEAHLKDYYDNATQAAGTLAKNTKDLQTLRQHLKAHFYQPSKANKH